MMLEFRLTGPRGDNPLGFLIALGALVTLEDAGCRALLAWQGYRPTLLADLCGASGARTGTAEEQGTALVQVLHQALRRERGAAAAATGEAKRQMEQAKTALKKKREEIKKRKLDRVAAAEARVRELDPLQRKVQEKEAVFKESLTNSAADPSVALGKNLNEANAAFLAYLSAACERCGPSDRRWADLAAAYGVADPAQAEERMLATPWALVRGDSKQDFLSSAEELMLRSTEEHLRQALFGPWDAQDKQYSLRLDVADDRRYALMGQDPTAGGNEPGTLWGANRLAFEALRFFPAMPVRAGMGVRAWRAVEGSWLQGCRVRWPLWREPAGAQILHSLLGLRDLWLDEPEARSRLRGMGVHAVLESRRIAVNKKFNLTPAAPVWVSAGGG